MNEIQKDFLHIKEAFTSIKSKFKEEVRKDTKIGKKLGSNAKQALKDLESGKIFTDDKAAENLKNTLTDTFKVVEMAALFSLPGGAIGLAALRKLLKSEGAKSLKIEKLLTLSIEEEEKIKEEVKEKIKEGVKEEIKSHKKL